MELPAKGCYECKSSRRDWEGTWKRDLQRIIKQAKHMRLWKSAQLKIVGGWDSIWGKYCKCLPISYISLDMGLWPLLEAGTGLGRPVVWTKTSTHTSSWKPQHWGRRQQSWSSPAHRQQSFNAWPGKMAWLEISCYVMHRNRPWDLSGLAVLS